MIDQATASAGEIRFFDPLKPHGFLSNFFEYRFFLRGELGRVEFFRTVEHYYQSRKCAGTEMEARILALRTPGGTKCLANAHRARWRPDWNEIRLEIMYRGVAAKFSTSAWLRQELLRTADAVLMEHSPTDLFWGIGKQGDGANHLGRILMRVRDELRAR